MASNRNTTPQATVYLITYSRADLTKIPDRQTFANIVVNAFEDLKVARVVQWAVCMENHVKSVDGAADGPEVKQANEMVSRQTVSRVMS